MFINLYTDFGFKRVFGREANQHMTIHFLNALQICPQPVANLTFKPNTYVGDSADERQAVVDLHTVNEHGDAIYIEMQCARQTYYKDRSLYYLSASVKDQAVVGEHWDYRLKPVYSVSLLDFKFKDAPSDKLLHRIKLMDEQTCKVFYSKLTMLYVELPKFTKTIEELTTDLDVWLFCIQHMHEFTERPPSLQYGIFAQLFDVAEIAKMTREERDHYHEGLKHKWDMNGVKDYYTTEGRQEGKIEIARVMLQNNEPLEKVLMYTGLSEAVIEGLKKKQ